MPEGRTRLLEMAMWLAVALACLAIVVRYFMVSRNSATDLARTSPLPVISQVGQFGLTNHLAKFIRNDDFLGKVWVANLIFTRCPGPCAEITRTVNRLRGELGLNDHIQWVSITADPSFDTPSVLSKYLMKWGDSALGWHFLTGSKTEIKQLAVDSLKLVVLDKEESQRTSADDLFLHSTRLVLVDALGQVRGTYEATEQTGRDTLIKDLKSLVPYRKFR